MNRKDHAGPPAVGGSSLLVIFAVLCLTIFAMLALSTAQANAKLSDATAQSVAAYYEADSQAEELLAGLRAGQVPAGVTALGDQTYSYTCTISETRQLQVTVRLEGTDYTVLQWQAVSTADWNADDSLPVYTGE